MSISTAGPSWVRFLGRTQSETLQDDVGCLGLSKQLRSICQRQMNEQDDSSKARARLYLELDVIDECGLTEFYLKLREFHAFAVSCGNVAMVSGTAASSLVIHLLGLSPVNPLHHQLSFATHLDHSRSVAPIVGLSVSGSGREILAHSRQTSGGEVASDQVPPYRVFRQSLSHSDDKGSRRIAAIDVLADAPGLKVIEQTSRLIAAKCGNDAAPALLPTDDSKTWKLFADGNTQGIQSCGSPGFRELLRRAQPKSLSELTALLALHQMRHEAAEQRKEEFLSSQHINRRAGELRTDEVLNETRGMVLFWEQVDELLQEIAGVDSLERRSLRKAIRQKDDSTVELVQQRFLSGANRRGIALAESGRLFAEIIAQSPQTVCKSTFVSSAYVAYQMGYLKAHFPDEFDADAFDHYNGHLLAELTLSYPEEFAGFQG